MVEKKTIIDFALGLAGGLLMDKVAEYAYVASGAYAASGNLSYDDFALNMAGVGLTAYKKEIGLGFLTGVQAGWLLSTQGIWLGAVLPPKLSLSAAKSRWVPVK